MQISLFSKDDIINLRAINPKRKSLHNIISVEEITTKPFDDKMNAEMGQIAPVNRRHEDWRVNDDKEIKIVDIAKTNAHFKNFYADAEKRYSNDVIVKNEDTGVEIIVNADGLKDTYAHAMTLHKIKTPSAVSAVYQIESLVENAILLDAHISDKNNKYKEKHTALMDKFYCAYRWKGDLYVAKISIEEYLDDKTLEPKRKFYNLADWKITPAIQNKIAQQPLKTALANKLAVTVSSSSGYPATKLTVSELRALVNTLDKNFFENKIDPATNNLERQPLLNEIAAEQDKQAKLNSDGRPVTPERDKQEIKIGDVLLIKDKKWRVESIDGDFSIELKNQNPDDINSSQAFFGHWKQHLEEEGYLIMPTAEKETQNRENSPHGEDENQTQSSEETVPHREDENQTQDNADVPHGEDEIISAPAAPPPQPLKAQIGLFAETDIAALRRIEPYKSILNFTNDEVTATDSFQKQYAAELKEKSPYERRKHDWREAENTTVNVTEVLDKGKTINDLKTDIKPKTDQYGNKYYEIPRGYVVNADTDFTINVGNKGLKDTQNYLAIRTLRNQDISAIVNALYQLPEILKNAVLLNTSTTDDKKNKSPNGIFMHTMYAPVNFQDKPFIAKITIEEILNLDNRNINRNLYNVSDIKIVPTGRSGFGDKVIAQPAKSFDTTVSNASGFGDKITAQPLRQFDTEISIAELFDYVNNLDKHFYKNPDSPGRKARLEEINKESKNSNNPPRGGGASKDNGGVPHGEDESKTEFPHGEDENQTQSKETVPHGEDENQTQDNADIPHREDENENAPRREEQISIKAALPAPPPNPLTFRPVFTSLKVNYRITDDRLGEGGEKAKYHNNIAAIKTLKAIEQENRLATEAEQEILSRYVSWGGLSQAFDEKNKAWANEYTELKELLTQDEYESARRTTPNAHYTSPTVIKAIHQTLERFGVKDGNILEPSCGVGNFFGLLPDTMKDAKLYGVELDSITGRIARNLYQNADIQITGFQNTDTPDNFFDVCVGNVPFGDYHVADKRYDKHNFFIHDYFFAKALDQTRPGGIIAFISSKGTLDKQNSKVREYIASRAEFLGAVRLPNNAFKANAGTEVTTDIIFLQKREKPITVTQDNKPVWIGSGEIKDNKTKDNIPVNAYFAQNPDMVLGKMTYGGRLYGTDKETTCEPFPNADLSEQLKTALKNISGHIADYQIDGEKPNQIQNKGKNGTETDLSVPAAPNVRNHSYALVNNTVYFRENSRMYPAKLKGDALNRCKAMVQIRDTARELVNLQREDRYGRLGVQIDQAQKRLNGLYDDFVNIKKYGFLKDDKNKKAFAGDSSYYLLLSLEETNEKGEVTGKADIFSKRTIKPKIEIDHADTSAEALNISINQKAKVDIGYMMALTGFTKEKIVNDLKGVIYRDLGEYKPDYINFKKPFYKIDDGVNQGTLNEVYTQLKTDAYDINNRPYVTADEYLSGNVRAKYRTALALAKLKPDLADEIKGNIEALEKAQPEIIPASDIAVNLGATWIHKEYIQDFMKDLFKMGRYDTQKVEFSEMTKLWNVSDKTRVTGSSAVLVNSAYGTNKLNGFKILEAALNLKEIVVKRKETDINGVEHDVTDINETTLAREKEEVIKKAFKEWLFKDQNRRNHIEALYNEIFNSTRLREYDGSHIEFEGKNPEIKLREHQVNAVARILYKGNTLLAHEVGAGKTYEIIAAAMELKRLGLGNKSLITVPNHMIEQWAKDFMKLYPYANILAVTKDDFTKKNRKRFVAKIATGDYDAIIISHSQFEKIPMSKEYQAAFIKRQIKDTENSIRILKESRGERHSVKEAEKHKMELEATLTKLLASDNKDDVMDFEELGVDRLFVDEAHSFKNLYFSSKMGNVPGINDNHAQKSTDMFMKTQYLDAATGYKGVIYATGTPISNSMTEMFTMMRYLQYDALERCNLQSFDAWASAFGEKETKLELSTTQTYQTKTRFAKFNNIPELMKLFNESADIKTAKELNLPRPEAEFHVIKAEPTVQQKEMVAELSKRATAVHNRQVKPEQDNMLTITNDGRKLGLDQRLINPALPDDPKSKVNMCMNNVYDIWKQTEADKLTQIVFCDLGTPGNKKAEFNIYDDVKQKLIDKGIPKNQIAFIHDAKNDKQKEKMFEKVRSGEIRILFGSTEKCGSGTNIQDKLIALHDLDCPWRPADLEQRSGRIIRQGNKNEKVHIYRYVTENTFDSYLFQTIQHKQRFISQIMTSKSPSRSMEDIDDKSLSYAEIKAICAGNPKIKEKMDLENDISKLKLLERAFSNTRYQLENKLFTSIPKAIKEQQTNIENYSFDIEKLKSVQIPKEGFISPFTINGKIYDTREEAGTALLQAQKHIDKLSGGKIGKYKGFDVYLSFDAFGKSFVASLKGRGNYSAALGDNPSGNITRLDNVLNNMEKRRESAENNIAELTRAAGQIKTELTKTWDKKGELEEKQKRLEDLNAELTSEAEKIGHTPETSVPDEGENQKSNDVADGKSNLLSKENPEPSAAENPEPPRSSIDEIKQDGKAKADAAKTDRALKKTNNPAQKKD